jgi:hypothetical protein
MAVFWVIALMMEAARTSEMLVNFYQTKRRCNPEESHLRTNYKKLLTVQFSPASCVFLSLRLKLLSRGLNITAF